MCVCTAALNMAVFLLIGKTLALTMNIAGVVKDWMLIGLSVLMYASPVTPLNLGGYFVAFLAVCGYVVPHCVFSAFAVCSTSLTSMSMYHI